MKKEILLKSAALVLAASILTGCASQAAAPAAAVSTSTTAVSAPVTTAAEPVTTTTTAALTTTEPKATTTAKPVTTTATEAVQEPQAEDISFVGYYLSDVYDFFKDYGLSDYLVYESDNGNSIIVKSNWVVIDEKVYGDYFVVTCEKVRNTGLISAAAKKINSFFEKEGVKETFDALKTLKDVGETWSYFKGLFKKDE